MKVSYGYWHLCTLGSCSHCMISVMVIKELFYCQKGRLSIDFIDWSRVDILKGINFVIYTRIHNNVHLGSVVSNQRLNFVLSQHVKSYVSSI
jgi:hypothetical protein